jgi:hypothetical protein
MPGMTYFEIICSFADVELEQMIVYVEIDEPSEVEFLYEIFKRLKKAERNRLVKISACQDTTDHEALPWIKETNGKFYFNQQLIPDMMRKLMETTGGQYIFKSVPQEKYI